MARTRIDDGANSPGELSKCNAGTEDPLAAPARDAWRACNRQYITTSQGQTNAGGGLPVASRCHHAVSQHHVQGRQPAQACSTADQRVVCLIKPRTAAGPQRCTHISRKLDMVPTSDGMVPVSELSLISLHHHTHAQCR